MPWSTHLLHFRASVWGSARVFGVSPKGSVGAACVCWAELELIQSHMAQKPVLRGEVGCACVAREVSVERGGMGVFENWVGKCVFDFDLKRPTIIIVL